MEVTGDMCGDGLGLTSWWEAGGEEGEEEGGDVAMGDAAEEG
jgi:hypothetical protein